MPVAFYTFLGSLVGCLVLFGIHLYEIKKGEIARLEYMRDISDRFIISQIRFWIRTYKKCVLWMREHAPDLARKIVRSVRKDNLRTQAKKFTGYIAKGIHDMLVYILKFFGRLRKRTGELAEKHLNNGDLQQ